MQPTGFIPECEQLRLELQGVTQFSVVHTGLAPEPISYLAVVQAGSDPS
jgi:hypothetical protein